MESPLAKSGMVELGQAMSRFGDQFVARARRRLPPERQFRIAKKGKNRCFP
jgi:hypothetical protein